MTKKKIYENKIMFICHESSRTGAPIQLLTLLKWIRTNSDLNFIILIVKGGELDKEFKKLAPTLVLYPLYQPKSAFRIFIKLWNRLTSNFRLSSFTKNGLSVIYSNTISNGNLCYKLKRKFKVKIITHVHELQSVINTIGPGNLARVIKATDSYIAASIAVKRNLVESNHIEGHKISVIYESISIPRDEPTSLDPASFEPTLKRDEFIVGGSGFVDTRKGYDLFIETARQVFLKKKDIDLRFIWIGDFGKGKEEEVHRLLMEFNLEGKVHFLGAKENPFLYYQGYDVFYLSSREDPFPLVMLENAYFKNPIICFNDTGGSIEFVDDDAGFTIENFNTEIAAEKILFL
jgi:glycosyltransferase involved in cell wall biosynthesis